MSANWGLVRNRIQDGSFMQRQMRRASLLAEEVFVSSNARRGSIFAAQIKHEDPQAYNIAKLHLFAAFLYIFGSICFIYGEVASDWLLQYRHGCVFYLVGCVLYLLAMNMSQGIHDGASNKLSDFLVWTAMILFIVGCSLAFSPGVTETGRRMDVMNWLFLIGSLILWLDALKCAFSAWMAETGLTLGNYMDVITTSIFMLAAIMGGGFYCPPLVYIVTPKIITEGLRCWLIGSLFCVIAPAKEVACGHSPSQTLPRSSNDHYGAVHPVHAAIQNMPAPIREESFADTSSDEERDICIERSICSETYASSGPTYDGY